MFKKLFIICLFSCVLTFNKASLAGYPLVQEIPPLAQTRGFNLNTKVYIDFQDPKLYIRYQDVDMQVGTLLDILLISLIDDENKIKDLEDRILKLEIQIIELSKRQFDFELDKYRLKFTDR